MGHMRGEITNIFRAMFQTPRHLGKTLRQQRHLFGYWSGQGLQRFFITAGEAIGLIDQGVQRPGDGIGGEHDQQNHQ